MTDPIGLPIYQKIADSLRSQIDDGTLEVGEQLPSTRELMDLYGASNNVVRQAIAVLRQEGLVVGQPGKGVYVQATSSEARLERASLDAVGVEVADLREKVSALAEGLPADTAAKVDQLQADFARLEANLRYLYDRLGHPYPKHQSARGRRRDTGS